VLVSKLFDRLPSSSQFGLEIFARGLCRYLSYLGGSRCGFSFSDALGELPQGITHSCQRGIDLILGLGGSGDGSEQCEQKDELHDRLELGVEIELNEI
jgi:hypothetical protein